MSFMVMSLSEWQKKALFIAHSGALGYTCHRASRQSCALTWLKIQHGKNFLKRNSISFATKQQNMHWRNHQQSLRFEWLVKAVPDYYRKVAQQSKMRQNNMKEKVLWMEQYQHLYVIQKCTKYCYRFPTLQLFRSFHLIWWSGLTFVGPFCCGWVFLQCKRLDRQPRTTAALL